MKHLIDKLRSNRRLDAEEYKALLLSRDTVLAAYLQELAREEVLTRFGNKIFIRGLIEITNRCRNNCYYCGIRKENRNIVRYELAQEEILSCCHEGYRLGFRTFVLQGGEAPVVKDEGIPCSNSPQPLERWGCRWGLPVMTQVRWCFGLRRLEC